MRDGRFIRRLERALPQWVEKGWVTRESGAEILAFEKSGAAGGLPYLTLALSIMGVLLLGAGVITFFAANWGLLPKIAKLAILFGAMWGAYAAASWLCGRGDRPLVGESVLLLAVILFGANIMLIAQIYHIAAHYPNGVLMWALGALLVAWVHGSQPVMVAALALGTLWTGMESFGYDRWVHWPYLVFWAACVPAIYRNQWRTAAHAACFGLLLWSLFTLFDAERWARGHLVALVQFYFLVYVACFLFGMVMRQFERTALFARAVQHYAGIAAMALLYLLTFPRAHREHTGQIATSDLAVWLALNVGGVALTVAVAGWHRRITAGSERPAYFDWGWYLLAGIAALFLVRFATTPAHGALIAIAFNFAFFAGLVWLVYAGVQAQDRKLVNSAFLFFALGLLSRYFDTFWTLLGRSYFFMLGGVLLLVAGYVLERQRRRLTRRIAEAAGGEGK